MKHRLDEDLKRLAAEPPGRGYDQLEARVWANIDASRQGRVVVSGVYALRAAAVVGALGLGVAGGGATAVAVAGEARSQEVSAFSVKADLAPSTLLDHHG